MADINVYQVLYGLEKRASVNDPDTPYEERGGDFYRLCTIQRHGACPVAILREALRAAYPISESKATSLIHAARERGEILRIGAGSATAYLTPEQADRGEQEARRQDADLISLGARLIGHGLAVTYRLTDSYRDYEHEDAVAYVRRQEAHIRRVELATGLAELAVVLDALDDLARPS